MVEMQFGINNIFSKYYVEFFRKIATISDIFEVKGSSFQSTTEKACLPKLSLVLGIIICCAISPTYIPIFRFDSQFLLC